MLHAGEKWAAVEYSTSPAQEEEEKACDDERQKEEETAASYVAPEDTGILPGEVHNSRGGVGVLDFIARSSAAPLCQPGQGARVYGSQAWLRPAQAHMYGKHKVWRGKSQGVMLVREAAPGPGADNIHTTLMPEATMQSGSFMEVHMSGVTL
ncbi:hypothetical protein PAMP_016597 [Pampus punctatissimus]